MDVVQILAAMAIGALAGAAFGEVGRTVFLRGRERQR